MVSGRYPNALKETDLSRLNPEGLKVKRKSTQRKYGKAGRVPEFREDYRPGDFVDDCCRNISVWTRNPRPLEWFDDWPVWEILAQADDLIRNMEAEHRGK